MRRSLYVFFSLQKSGIEYQVGGLLASDNRRPILYPVACFVQWECGKLIRGYKKTFMYKTFSDCDNTHNFGTFKNLWFKNVVVREASRLF